MTSRSYTVGLPVTVTVDDNGIVTYDIDTSEAGAGIRESDDAFDEYGEETTLDDADAVDHEHSQRFDEYYSRAEPRGNFPHPTLS